MYEHTQGLIEVLSLSWQTPLLGLGAAALLASLVMLLEAMMRGNVSSRLRWWVVWAFAAVSMGALMLLEPVNLPIWNDEVEHLHCAWLLSRGEIPWRDFWEHHPPALWQALAPLVLVLPESVTTLWAVRGVALGLMVCAMVVAATVRADAQGERPRMGRRLVTIGLLCGTFVPASFAPWIHAENVAGAVIAVGLFTGWVSIVRASGVLALLTGALWSAAAVLTPKFAPLALAWPVAAAWVLWSRSRRDTLRLWMGWVAGGVIPIAAQTGWLWHHGVLGQCLYWCFGFNRPQWGMSRLMDLAIILGALLPVGLVWWWGLRSLQGTQWRGYHALLAAGALAGFLSSPVYWGYSAWGLFVVLVPASVVGLQRFMAWLEVNPNPMARGAACIGMLTALCTGMCATTFQYAAPAGFGLFVAQSRSMEQLMELGRGRRVLCVIPNHPVFSRDATSIWHSWQLLHARSGDVMHGDAIRAAEALSRGEPELVGVAAARDLIFATGSTRTARAWRKAQENYELVMNGRYLLKRTGESPKRR